MDRGGRLAVGLVAACLVEIAGARPADSVGAGNVLKRWVATMSGTQAVTQDQAVADAQNYDVIVANKRVFTPYLAAMHAANPDLKVVAYMNGAYAQKNQGPGTTRGYPATWYLKDANGNYITSFSDGNWLMDVTNPGWISDREQACSSLVTDSATTAAISTCSATSASTRRTSRACRLATRPPHPPVAPGPRLTG
jgi:hypothetical protein